MTRTPRGEITELLHGWNRGEAQAREALMARVYSELRRLAASFLNHEGSPRTLDTVGLVTEAYLKLIDQEKVNWRNRAHFFALAGRIMRRILVDQARRRQAVRHGHGLERIPLECAAESFGAQEPDILALHVALEALAERSPEEARVVELRFFGGLARREIAEVTGLSSATVARRWRTARIWLLHYFEEGRALDEPASAALASSGKGP